MKVAAIICELNPAHNGHKYIFDKARELTKADFVIAVMSGDFVQRGEPAIFDKHLRTKMALNIGADAVIELPGIFATGSAQYFARGSVALINALGCVDYLVFGSESADINIILNPETSTSNDILGREYLNALKFFNCNITPVLVKREGSAYNEDNYTIDQYPSAKSIRNEIFADTTKSKELLTFIESNVSDSLSPLNIDSFSPVLVGKLLFSNADELSLFFDVYEDLAYKICSYSNSFNNYSDFCMSLKSKDIAYSHIKRALLHIMLDYRKSDFESIKETYLSYIRLLGFNRNASALLSEIKENSSLPIISKLADADKHLNHEALKLLEKDIAASHLYSFVATGSIINEYQRQITII